MSSASHTFAALDNPTVAQVNGWAQGTLGIMTSTTASGTVGTSSGTATTILTAPAVTLVAGRRIKIAAECSVQSSVAGDTAVIEIREGATLIQQRQYLCTPVNQAMGAPISMTVQPSAGTHTYTLVCWRNIGTGNVIVFAQAGVPMYILVEDIGAV